MWARYFFPFPFFTLSNSSSSSSPIYSPPLPSPSPPHHHQIIGRGGFGCVYRSRHRATGKEVALKVLDKGYIHANGLTQRVVSEVELHVRLLAAAAAEGEATLSTSPSTTPTGAKRPSQQQHQQQHKQSAAAASLHISTTSTTTSPPPPLSPQHIIGLLGCFEGPHAVYLVLELSRGGDLYKHLKRQGGRLPLMETRHIIRQVLASVAFLHRHHVLHRDIKLSNLLIMDAAARPLQIKLADFGLAIEEKEEEERGREEGGRIRDTACAEPLTIFRRRWRCWDKDTGPRQTSGRWDAYSTHC